MSSSVVQGRIFRVAAGKTETFPIAGKFIAIKTATVPFILRFDGHQQNNVESGMVVPYKSGFRGITIDNDNLVALEAFIYWGDDGVQFTESREPSTAMRPDDGTLAINDGDPQDFPGIAPQNASYQQHGIPKGSRRSHIVIFNEDNALQLDVYKQNPTTLAYEKCGAVFQNSPYPFFGADNLRISNPNGGSTVPYSISEHFYV